MIILSIMALGNEIFLWFVPTYRNHGQSTEYLYVAQPCTVWGNKLIDQYRCWARISVRSITAPNCGIGNVGALALPVSYGVTLGLTMNFL